VISGSLIFIGIFLMVLGAALGLRSSGAGGGGGSTRVVQERLPRSVRRDLNRLRQDVETLVTQSNAASTTIQQIDHNVNQLNTAVGGVSTQINTLSDEMRQRFDDIEGGLNLGFVRLIEEHEHRQQELQAFSNDVYDFMANTTLTLGDLRSDVTNAVTNLRNHISLVGDRVSHDVAILEASVRGDIRDFREEVRRHHTTILRLVHQSRVELRGRLSDLRRISLRNRDLFLERFRGVRRDLLRRFDNLIRLIQQDISLGRTERNKILFLVHKSHQQIHRHLSVVESRLAQVSEFKKDEIIAAVGNALNVILSQLLRVETEVKGAISQVDKKVDKLPTHKDMAILLGTIRDQLKNYFTKKLAESVEGVKEHVTDEVNRLDARLTTDVIPKIKKIEQGVNDIRIEVVAIAKELSALSSGLRKALPKAFDAVIKEVKSVKSDTKQLIKDLDDFRKFTDGRFKTLKGNLNKHYQDLMEKLNSINLEETEKKILGAIEDFREAWETTEEFKKTKYFKPIIKELGELKKQSDELIKRSKELKNDLSTLEQSIKEAITDSHEELKKLMEKYKEALENNNKKLAEKIKEELVVKAHDIVEAVGVG